MSIQAGTVTFSRGSKSAEEYKNHKCIQGTVLAGSLQAQLTPDELCRYGKMGCSSLEGKSKITAYCEFPNLSQCFEKKAWFSIDQHLGVKLTKAPGLVTYGLKKGSVREGKTCAYWD